MGSETVSPFHTIDFTDENMKPGTDTWRKACQVVRTSFEESGCFVAIYDRVSKELSESLVSVLEEFYSLPLESRKRKSSEKPFHGYIGEAPWLPMYESNGVDDAVNIESCRKFASTKWPEGNDRFCEVVNEYSKQVKPLDNMTKRLLLESYGVDMKRCDSLIESSKYLFKCFQYKRPLGNDDDETNTLGLQSHSDMSFVSIIQQVNNIGGLEVLMNGGEWKRLDASPNTFAVMAGDVFHVWSNGRVRTCEHRVMMNNETKETRYAAGMFSFGGDMVDIPEELIDDDHPLRYKSSFDNYGYIRFFYQNQIHDVYPRIQAFCGI